MPLGFSLQFGQPYALALLLALPLFYLVSRERLASLPVGARRSALVVRLLVVTLVALSLSQPTLSRRDERLEVVFALDVSDSVSASIKASAEAWIAQAMASARQADDSAEIAFAAETAIRKGFGAPPGAAATALRSDGTNIAEALHLAQALFPPAGGRRVVLITDGQETSGRGVDEAQYLAQQGIQVSVVPLGVTNLNEVLVDAVDVPAYLRQGETFAVAVSIYSTYQTQATLQVLVDDRSVTNEVVQLRTGGNRFGVNLTASSVGFHSIRARIESPGDTYPENNEGFGYTVVKAPGRLLAIAAKPEEAAPIKAALESNGLQVDVQPPSFVPPTFAPLAAYDGILLVNVPASSLTFDQMKTITGFVQSQGKGLVVFGGDQSLSLGGYADSPLADALPVQMSVPGGTDRGNIGVVLVVDKSGSMESQEEGVTKVSLARDAARKAVSILASSDVVGVIGFDTESQVIVPAQAVGDAANRLQIDDMIGHLDASGGTDIRQALEAALELMRGVRAQYRHIILLSDGRPNADATYDDLINAMKTQKITLSTIAIGSDADLVLMQELAQEGSGRYYYVPNAKDVPTITMRETRIASGATSAEGVFRPKLPASGQTSPLLRSLSEAQLPELSGYDVTLSKSTADVALVSDREDPILAHWQYGLGRVVAWTSDTTPKWSANWLTWPELGRFWSQVVRWSLPNPASPNLGISSSVSGHEVSLRVDVTDDAGSFLDLQDIRARVLTAEGQSDELILEQTQPGRYETSFAVAAEGAYQVDVAQYQSGSVVRQETGGFLVPYAQEYRAFGANPDTLAQIAAVGGGRVLRDPREAFASDIPFDGQTRLPLWPYLLGFALLLFPFDVGIRRLKISPAYVRNRVWVPFVRVLSRAARFPARLIDLVRQRRPL